MRYRHPDGRTFFVSQGLGDTYGTFYKNKPDGGNHRVKSPKLPMRDTWETAEADLAAYAKAKGLEPLVLASLVMQDG